jgi:hypothetical protein
LRNSRADDADGMTNVGNSLDTRRFAGNRETADHFLAMGLFGRITSFRALAWRQLYDDSAIYRKKRNDL